jgi:hypothetical protein
VKRSTDPSRASTRRATKRWLHTALGAVARFTVQHCESVPQAKPRHTPERHTSKGCSRRHVTRCHWAPAGCRPDTCVRRMPWGSAGIAGHRAVRVNAALRERAGATGRLARPRQIIALPSSHAVPIAGPGSTRGPAARVYCCRLPSLRPVATHCGSAAATISFRSPTRTGRVVGLQRDVRIPGHSMPLSVARDAVRIRGRCS